MALFFSSLRLKAVITNNNKPRKDPEKAARSKNAISQRAVDASPRQRGIQPSHGKPALGHSQTLGQQRMNRLAAVDTASQSILTVWGPAWSPSSKSALGRRNSSHERHGRKARSKLPLRQQKFFLFLFVKARRTQHFPLSLSLPGSLLTAHDFPKELPFQQFFQLEAIWLDLFDPTSSLRLQVH